MEGNSVAGRLRERRIELGLSQRALAGRLGVSRALIVQLESGRPAWPGLRRRLASELGLDEAELTGTPKPEAAAGR